MGWRVSSPGPSCLLWAQGVPSIPYDCIIEGLALWPCGESTVCSPPFVPKPALDGPWPQPDL